MIVASNGCPIMLSISAIDIVLFVRERLLTTTSKRFPMMPRLERAASVCGSGATRAGNAH